METRSQRAAKRRRVTRGRYAAAAPLGLAGSSSSSAAAARASGAGHGSLSFMSLRSGKRVGAAASAAAAAAAAKAAAKAAGPGAPKQRGAFSRFMDLPPELRVQIWQLAAEAASQPFHPLRVRLYRGSERVYRGDSRQTFHTRTVLRLATMPDLALTTKPRRSLLQVSREARGEVQKLWDSKISLERGRALHFSFAHDIVYLDMVNQGVVLDMRIAQLQNNLPDFMHAIGHVGFDMVPIFPLWMTNGRNDAQPALQLLFCFSRLHSVSLVHFKAFYPEIQWSFRSDVEWILSRARRHRIAFRSFPALPGFNYSQQGAVGNRQPVPYIRHECAICTIHKCAYMNDLLQNRHVMPRPQPALTPTQIKWLGGLKHHMLVASTPQVALHIRAYRDSSLGWWIKSPWEDCSSDDETEEDDEGDEDDDGEDDEDDEDDEDGDDEDDDGDGFAFGDDDDSVLDGDEDDGAI